MVRFEPGLSARESSEYSNIPRHLHMDYTMGFRVAATSVKPEIRLQAQQVDTNT